MNTGTTSVPEAVVDGYLGRLIDELEASGQLRSPHWREVLRAVPRHVFLPRYYRFTTGEDGLTYWEPVTPERNGVDAWLRGVYRNQTCVTQLDGDDSSWSSPVPVTGEPTSSSTLPGLIVQLLEVLDPTSSARVLASGTGSGYTTALLCGYLGDSHVVSVDTDPALVERARRRLATLGFHPTVVAGDGQAGYPPGAPYDRVLATHSVARVPGAWVEQTKPGGAIVGTLSGHLYAYATFRLTVGDDGTASGRFLPDDISFMIARQDRRPPVGDLLRAALGAEPAARRHATLDPRELEARGFRFAAQLALPGLLQVETVADNEPITHFLHPEGSWARVRSGASEGLVEQGGPRAVWDHLEAVHRSWRAHGSPGIERYGLTVAAGRGEVWLDSPTSGIVWRLPTH